MSRPRSLRHSRDFRRVYRAGRRARSNGITAWATIPQGEARLGLVVPGSVGSAVARNRLKRRLRAVLGGLGPHSLDLVVRADRSAAGVPFQELENHVVTALRRVGALA